MGINLVEREDELTRSTEGATMKTHDNEETLGGIASRIGVGYSDLKRCVDAHGIQPDRITGRVRGACRHFGPRKIRQMEEMCTLRS